MLSARWPRKVLTGAFYAAGAIAGLAAFFAILAALPLIAGFETARGRLRWWGSKNG